MNRRLQFVFSFMALMVLSIGTSWSQAPSGLPCNAQVNISIDAECEVQITPQTMHQTNPGTLVRITIKDFGLAPAISTANLLNIFPGATIGGQGSGRWVEAPVLTIKTKEIKQVLPLSSATTANTITLGNSTGFSSRGLWTTKVSVFSGTNSCWGTVVIEDKLPPVITGPEDRTVSCLLSTLDQRGNPAVSVTGDADATGSCTDVIKKGYFDEVTESKCTPQSLVLKQIRRIFIVENPNGMQARDTQLITVLAVNLFTEMQCPEPLVLIKCDTDASPSGIAAYYKANPDPLAPGDSIKAWPYVIDAATGARYYLPENKSVCNVIATYSDVNINHCKPNCVGSVKIARSWTIIDWCAGSSFNCVQVVKKVDDIKPVISEITTKSPYSVTAWGCNVDITLPNATVTDRCDPDAQIVSVTDSLGFIVATRTSAGWLAKNVPHGKHTFIYTASDCCGNTASETITIEVKDRVAPVASAKEYITLSLTQSGNDAPADLGSGKLFAVNVNNGSYDNCTPVRLEIRRDGGANCENLGTDGHNNNSTFDNSGHPQDNDLDTDNGEYVKFCCSDLNQVENGISYGIHKVILRVWDDADGDGVFGSEGDNYNETWTNVRVEDKLVPNITCPAPILTYCDRDTGIDITYSFGKWTAMTDANTPKDFQPAAKGVCGEYKFEFWDEGSLNTCGVGEFTRTYRIVGFTSVTCTVTITVDPSEDRPALEWPVSLHEWNSCVLSEADVNLNTVRARIDIEDEFGWEGCKQNLLPNGNGNGVNEYCSTESVAGSGESALLPYTTSGTRRPAPASTSVSPVNTPSGAPRFNSSYKEPGCNVYGKRISIEEYTVGEGCKKWLVKWDYINWCCNEISACRSTVYKYEDKKAPEITVCDSDQVTITDGVNCKATVTLNPVGFDEGLCASGLSWRVRIYAGNPAATGTATAEIVNTSYRLTSTPGTDGPASTERLTGQTPVLTISNVPAGVHGVRYILRDGCGNVKECTTTITVLPKDPTPYCVSLSSAVMKNGLVELWAIDFDKGSFQNCSATGGYRVLNDSVRIDNTILFYTFNNKKTKAPEHPVVAKLHVEHYFKGFGIEATPSEYAAGDAQIWRPVVDVRVRPLLPDGSVNPLGRNEYTIVAGSSSGMQFGCKAGDKANGVAFPVEMRVWDVRTGLFIPGTNEGSDFCRTMLTLVDNQGACNPDGSLIVKGMVATSKGDGLSGVETKLVANLPEFPVVSNTQNGAFSFAKVPAGVEFELSARKNNDHINGVNTLDLVTIQRHILGIAKLGDAYKYVAADADNNQKINLSDLVVLRKLVLGITNELPNNTSWRFVDAAQKFADISNPWPLDEVIVTTANANTNDFVAVKVGDVNIDAAANATSTNLVSRSTNTVKFVVDQATINAGEVVSIPVRAANFNEAYGFQMTTELKGLELVNVQSGAIAVEEGMVATPKAGVMTMSWTAANGATVSDDAVLFTINVRAKSTVEVSRAIAITSSVTEAVAFTGSDLTAGNVELEVRGAGSGAYALGQNEPNPFKAETTIKFSMPEAGEAKFRVVDVTGRVLVNEVIKAAKGENVITLKRADITATGVVYYQIESGGYTATKKMVIIE